MTSPPRFPTDYEIGDLVILLYSIYWVSFSAPAGELAIVIKIYKKRTLLGNLYDCRLKLPCGRELDVWFGEIHKLLWGQP